VAFHELGSDRQAIFFEHHQPGPASARNCFDRRENAMSLSKPVARDHIHTRDIQCRGFRRQDGLWDIEGLMVDTKTYSFDNVDRGAINSGEPIHKMWLRLTVDDDLKVHEAEAATDAGPFTICGDITPSFKLLEGLTIGRGWRKTVLERLGRTKGCTHLTDMLTGQMAVVAFQTVTPAREKRGAASSNGDKPGLLDSCHALATDTPVVKKLWPKFYTGE